MQCTEKCKNVKLAEADLATMPKEGVDTGLKAIHPLTGERRAQPDFEHRLGLRDPRPAGLW